jgi:hypothetical protein
MNSKNKKELDDILNNLEKMEEKNKEIYELNKMSDIFSMGNFDKIHKLPRIIFRYQNINPAELKKIKQVLKDWSDDFLEMISDLNNINKEVLSGKIRDGKVLSENLKEFSEKLHKVLLNEINRENRRREVERNEKISKIEQVTFFVRESRNGRTLPQLIKVQVNNLQELKINKNSNFIFLYNLYVNGQQKIDTQKWKNKLKSFTNDNSYFIKQFFTKEDINLLFEVQNNGISQIIKLKNRNIFNTKNI